MLPSLSEMMRELPPISQTFFHPSPEFMDWLVETTRGQMVVEVGCGQGLVIRELAKRGVQAIGLDPRYEGDVLKDFEDGVKIVPLTAERVLPGVIANATKPLFVLICRPAHTGYTEEVAEMLKGTGHRMVYVSKPENAAEDLGDFLYHRIDFLEPIGRQREVAYEVLIP